MLHRRDLKVLEYILWRIALALEEGNNIMANNFDNMTAAMGRVEDEVRAVAEAIANPAVDNNSQPVIDDLTARLNAAADALGSAAEAENAEDAGPASTEPTPTENPAPSEGGEITI